MLCVAHIRGTRDGHTFQEMDVSFEFGEGELLSLCLFVCV